MIQAAQTSNGPPKGVDGSALWAQLAARERPTRVVDYPGAGESPGQVALRILTMNEMQACRANADKEAKRLLATGTNGDLGYEDIYRNELVVQLVCTACRAPEDTRVPTFPTAKHARDKLTEDDFAVLFEAYKLFKIEAGPILSEMTSAEMEAWITLLQEGGSRIPLARCSSGALCDLVMHLIARLPKSPTDSGSAGSPPDVPSNGPSDTSSAE